MWSVERVWYFGVTIAMRICCKVVKLLLAFGGRRALNPPALRRLQGLREESFDAVLQPFSAERGFVRSVPL